MKYSRNRMEKLIKAYPELGDRMREVMKDLELEKSFALKALYHSEVKDDGPYRKDYQDI